MIRILVFSDSHGHCTGMCRTIENIPADFIVHCGDYSKDAVLLRKLYSDIPVISVLGNNEYGSSLDEPCEILNTGGVNIFITHGHRQDVKSGIDRLVYDAKGQECTVCLFGHTHRALCEEKDGILLLNPGSARGIDGTYGVLEIEDGKAKGAILAIN